MLINLTLNQLFKNGYSCKDVYVEQPKGFVIKGNENKVHR